MEEDIHASGNRKRAGVAIFISDKLDFKSKNVSRDKEGHYIMIKWSIHQEDRTIINISIPNTKALKYTKQTLTEIRREIDSNTITLDFTTSLLITARTPTEDQRENRGLEQHYRLNEPNRNIQNISLNSSRKHVQRSPGDKTSLNKFKNTKIIPNILSKLV